MANPFEMLEEKIKALQVKREAARQLVGNLIEAFEKLCRLATDNDVTIELRIPGKSCSLSITAAGKIFVNDTEITLSPSSWEGLMGKEIPIEAALRAFIERAEDVATNVIAIHCLQGFLNGEIEPNVK